ncbi:MAG: hypothetical protein AB1736_13860 [Chloroflexota bacterium]
MHIDRRLLGWGAFLIIVGTIPLLVRAGYLDAGLVGDWPSLWPLLLIGWGLGLVLRRTPGEVLGSAISVVVLGVMVGGLISTGFGGFPAFGACGSGDGEGGASFGNRIGALRADGRVGIEFNCGTLVVTAVDGSNWSVRGTSPDGQGPDIEADAGGVQIRPRDDGDFMGFLEEASHWQIELPKSPTLDLGVTLNAGDGSVNLGGANLDSLSVTVNAGSIEFALAGVAALSEVSATVNAGSAMLQLPRSLDRASMTLNAGSVDVCVPTGTPVRVSWSGALASNNFDGAGLDKVDDGHWQTPGYSSADGLDLNVSANAGSFSLDFGGACDA